MPAISGPLAKSLTKILTTKPKVKPKTDEPVLKQKVPEPPFPEPEIDGDILTESGERAQRGKEFMATSIDDYDTTKSWQPNFNTIDTDEQTQSMIAGLADNYSTEIDEARRGQIHDIELHSLARELGQKPEFLAKIMARKTGEPANAETIVASRHVLHESGRQLKAGALKVLAGEATDKDKIAFHRQWDFHRQFMSQHMGARAEVGRALRAYGVPLGSESFQQKRTQELVETMEGRFDINEVAEQIANMDSFEGVNKIVKAQAGGMSKGGAAIVEHFVGSILSGTGTQTANFMGNVSLTVIGPVETAIAARMGNHINKDSIIPGEASAQYAGILSGFWDALRVAGKVAKTGEPYGGISKFESAHPKAISSEAFGWSKRSPWGFMADVAGVIDRAPMERVMGSVDGFFRVLNERAKVAQLAYREASRRMNAEGLSKEEFTQVLTGLLENPPEHIKEAAVDYSMYNMLATPLKSTSRHIQKGANSSAPLKIVIPFIRTPVNMFKMTYGERTPLGLMFKSYRDDLAASGERGQMARARLTLGSMICATSAAMYYNGMLTDGGPVDTDQRRAIMATGWRPYSIVTTDNEGNKTYHPFARLEPIASLLKVSADLAAFAQARQHADANGIDDDIMEAMGALTLTTMSNTADQTMLTGVRDIIGVMDKGPMQEHEAKRYFANMANAMAGMSGFRRDLRKLDDPVMRDNSAQSQVDAMVNKVKDGTPFYSETLPARLDVFGQPVEYSYVLNPFTSSGEVDDPILNHLIFLGEQTGQGVLSMPSRNIQGIRLRPEEYHNLVKMSRDTIKAGDEHFNFKEMLSKLVASDDYRNLPTAHAKAAVIKDLQRKFDKAAKNNMLQENESLLERVLLREAKKITEQTGQEVQLPSFGMGR